MSEFKVTDTAEIRNPDAERFKEIRPESKESAQDAKSFWDNTFMEMSEPVKEYDDNGNLYREGTELVPNNEYTINGYEYKTDDQGRIVSAEGQLHMKNRQGRLTIRDSIAVRLRAIQVRRQEDHAQCGISGCPVPCPCEDTRLGILRTNRLCLGSYEHLGLHL